MSITRLINQYGDLLANIKMLQAKAEALKANILDTGVTEQFTSRYKLSVFTQERGYLDKTAVVEELGLAWVLKHTNVTNVTIVKITPVEQKMEVAA